MWLWLTKKLAFKAIGKLFARFKMRLIAVVLGALFGFIGYYIYTAEQAKSLNVVLEYRLANLLTTLDRNEAALDQCRLVNAANETEAIRQASLARIATERVIALEALADTEIEIIVHETETIRTDLPCPAITDDYRAWVRN